MKARCRHARADVRSVSESHTSSGVATSAASYISGALLQNRFLTGLPIPLVELSFALCDGRAERPEADQNGDADLEL